MPPTLAAVSGVRFVVGAEAARDHISRPRGQEAFAGGLKVLPSFKVPAAFSALKTAPAAFLKVVLPYAATMACVGLVESLLVDGIADDGKPAYVTISGRHRRRRARSTRQECIGQGLGNLASGPTGGQGGCATIGQSLINVEAGGTETVGYGYGWGIGCRFVSAAPLLGRIPIAALVGVMFLGVQADLLLVVAPSINKILKVDLFAIALVSTVTVTKDLAQAVFYGVVVGFRLPPKAVDAHQGHVISANRGLENVPGRRALFFGSTSTFSNQFDPKRIRMTSSSTSKSSRAVDHSALESINELARKYGDLSKKVHFRGLSSDCYQPLELCSTRNRHAARGTQFRGPDYEVAGALPPSTAIISVPRKDAAPPAEPEE